MTRTTSTLFLTALLAVCAGAAGCDPGRSASGASSPSASASVSRQQLLALGQEWVQCLRDHGLTRMPDADLTPEGYLQFPPQNGYNWKADLHNRPQVIEACKSIEDRYPPSAFRPKEQVSAENLRKLAEYAKCIREHGIPEFPDPNAAGEFDLTGTSLANGVPPQQMNPAAQACRHIWSGDIRIQDNGGGKK
ncbi:hypothetical protein GA0070624_5063 [Micromonospora rhizosphaerae]|uniref:Lipoprotein n=1 Tax=Micromonospora rhizosphaerae TaxID=568872 RepID=A0A1C6SYR6_9ACTN|nr:hypothetical protein [Micromonospora rhizosphaerae]SCL34711.1 hypothetical protein GA0070624_5063 [Micromonospora rhizosphaerae]